MIRYDDYKGMSFEEICKEQIFNYLDEHEGQTIYPCDLNVAEYDFMDGAFVLGTYNAREFIKDFWEEAFETYEAWIFATGGERILNPFENPEKFTIYMEDWGVEELLNKCEFIQDNWDEEVVLTPDVISQIKEEISKALEKEPHFGGR